MLFLGNQGIHRENIQVVYLRGP